MLLNIAVDAMGGDNAPDEIVRGAALASKQTDGKIFVVGDSERINEILKSCSCSPDNIVVVHTSEVIENDDKPTQAIRRKKDSSLVRCFSLLSDGTADAMVSAGSTGALLAGSIHFLKRLPGVLRPALAPFLPSDKRGFLIVDGGANTNSRPDNLLQFAIMGSIYAEKVMGIENPRVGLLNIGTEDGKGNELTKAAFELLSQSGLNFVGNIEGRDPIMGNADIVVCDGFSGNVLLKATEGAGLILFKNLKEVMLGSLKTKIAALMLKKGLYSLKSKYNYKEYGGAPFLGVSSCVIKAHGTSDAHSVASAIMQANGFAASGALKLMEIQINSSNGGNESDI